MSLIDYSLLDDASKIQIQVWEGKGWTVEIEANKLREPAERYTCEICESIKSKPLPHGLGYVCGYGEDANSAVSNANMKLNNPHTNDDIK